MLIDIECWQNLTSRKVIATLLDLISRSSTTKQLPSLLLIKTISVSWSKNLFRNESNIIIKYLSIGYSFTSYKLHETLLEAGETG